MTDPDGEDLPGIESREKRLDEEALKEALGLPEHSRIYGFGTDGEGWTVKYHALEGQP